MEQVTPADGTPICPHCEEGFKEGDIITLFYGQREPSDLVVTSVIEPHVIFGVHEKCAKSYSKNKDDGGS